MKTSILLLASTHIIFILDCVLIGAITHVDLLKLKLIFNAIARRAGKGESFYTQDLTYFQTRFNQEQANIVGMKLLKILI